MCVILLQQAKEAALYHYREDNAYVLADSSARVSFILQVRKTIEFVASMLPELKMWQ